MANEAFEVIPTGKLPVALLRELLGGLRRPDPSVRLGPAIGEDAAAVEVNGRAVVVAADPITFATDRIGWYAVHVNANDVACCGAQPRWFTATVLLPAGSGAAAVADVFAQLETACRSIGASLVGGHTEITEAVNQPVIAGQMIGEADPAEIRRSADARAGDQLLLTGGIAIEGTAILCRELQAALSDVPRSLIEDGAALLDEPGISVLPAARIALANPGVHALHDPTEGGLAGALAELCSAAGTGVEIAYETIPHVPACREVCTALGIDPLGLIASGALLIACAQDAAAGLLEAFAEAGIRAARIGRLTRAPARMLLRDGRREPLPEFARDELARAFESAI